MHGQNNIKFLCYVVTNLFLSVTRSSHIEGGIQAEGVGEYGAREDFILK